MLMIMMIVRCNLYLKSLDESSLQLSQVTAAGKFVVAMRAVEYTICLLANFFFLHVHLHVRVTRFPKVTGEGKLEKENSRDREGSS